MNIVDCGHDADKQKSDCTTGYGINKHKEKICFECCGIMDEKQMIEDGKITLYLTHDLKMKDKWGNATISNWPGTLKFLGRVKRGHHNIAHNRYDVWFYGPDGKEWHGVQYGDNTQILDCKRNK